MNITDELERLAKLHHSGALSDDEFLQAKQKLLRQPQQSDSMKPSHTTLGEAANRYVSFQIVMAIIGVIIFLIVFFGVMRPQRQKIQWMQIEPSSMPTPTFPQ